METSKIIEALEELNMEYIVLSGSKEVEWARERIRLQKKLAEGILWYPAARIRRKRALSKIPGKDHPVNWNEKQWKSLMHEGDPNKKYVVYSCITGGYDRAQKPTYYSDHCDYIMFLNFH